MPAPIDPQGFQEEAQNHITWSLDSSLNSFVGLFLLREH